jgi:hypothetical protein
LQQEIKNYFSLNFETAYLAFRVSEMHREILALTYPCTYI